jgi:hypothetical protein
MECLLRWPHFSPSFLARVGNGEWSCCNRHSAPSSDHRLPDRDCDDAGCERASLSESPEVDPLAASVREPRDLGWHSAWNLLITYPNTSCWRRDVAASQECAVNSAIGESLTVATQARKRSAGLGKFRRLKGNSTGIVSRKDTPPCRTPDSWLSLSALFCVTGVRLADSISIAVAARPDAGYSFQFGVSEPSPSSRVAPVSIAPRPIWVSAAIASLGGLP